MSTKNRKQIFRRDIQTHWFIFYLQFLIIYKHLSVPRATVLKVKTLYFVMLISIFNIIHEYKIKVKLLLFI